MRFRSFSAQLPGHGLKIYILINRALRILPGETNTPLMRKTYGRDGFTVITIIVQRWISKSRLGIILKAKEWAKACYMAFSTSPLDDGRRNA